MKISKELDIAMTSGNEWSKMTSLKKSRLWHMVAYCVNRDCLDEEGTQIPSATLKSKFKSEYSRLLEYLESQNVLKRTGYSTGRFCRSFELNPELFLSEEVSEVVITKPSNVEHSEIEFRKLSKKEMWLNDDFDPNTLPIISSINEQDVVKYMASLSKYLSKEFELVLEKEVADIKEQTFKTNEEINKTVICINNNIYSKAKHIEYAAKDGKIIVEDKGKHFKVSSIAEYRNLKISRVRLAWSYCIDSLIKGDLYARRNETNSRLDTSFTAISKLLFNVIKHKNNFVEIDFKNSQYALLANLMRHRGVEGEDVIKFYNFAVTGRLYEFMANELNVTRNEAKSLLMEIVFSNGTAERTNGQKLFGSLFPNVSKFIKDYKKQNDLKLPVLLQRIESHIMIDGLYPELLNANIKTFTRHDSVYVKEADKRKTISIMKKLFKKLDLEIAVNGSIEGETIELN